MAEASAEEVDGTGVVQDGQQEISNSKGEPSVLTVESTHAAGETDVVPTSGDDDDHLTTEPAGRGRGGGRARGRGREKQLASGLRVTISYKVSTIVDSIPMLTGRTKRLIREISRCSVFVRIIF